MQRRWNPSWWLWIGLVLTAGCAHPDTAPSFSETAVTEPAAAAEPPAARVQEPLAPTGDCDVRGPRPPPPVVERTALRYGVADNRRLLLDLVVPEAAGPHPLVVLFHGGGFRAGTRHHGRTTLLHLARRGYAAASVDYRLLRDGRGVFPAAVSDARCAIRWLRSHAAEHDLDPERIVAVGFSAGGHLSSMLATAADVDGLDDQCPLLDVSPAVSAAVSFFGPSDFRVGVELGVSLEGAAQHYLGVRRADRPEIAELASPAAHVDPADPPVLLVHDTGDPVLSVEQSRHFERVLSAAGVPVLLVERRGRSHGYGMFERGHEDHLATCTTLAFLERVTGGAAR